MNSFLGNGAVFHWFGYLIRISNVFYGFMNRRWNLWD